MSSAPNRLLRALFLPVLLLAAAPLVAQQTGEILGTVSDSAGAVLPGVTVQATSNVLPRARETVSAANGDYRLPALPPGTYTLTFNLSGMQAVTRTAQVLLAQQTRADATLGVAGITEAVTVTAEVSLIDKDSATIKSSIASQEIMGLPVGQEYRDLQKLIPGVQYSQDQTRGPSAGGSGQDNVYQFDGVNVNLPLFGTLSAEPASHDIAEVTVVKGGARAVDFDRSGGFSIDTVSRSGTSEFHGQVGYQFQSDAMSADLDSGSLSRYERNLGWLTANLGGPILKDTLYFYGSYYRPTQNRDNRSNLYGELPDYESTRNEGFGKLTFTPTQTLLLNASYRDSKRVDKSDLFASNASATTGTGNESRLKIFTGDGSWVVNPSSFVTFKYTHFENLTSGTPDFVAGVDPNLTPGTPLDVNSLDTLGRLTVPTPVSGQTAYNAFVQPLIDRYGYSVNGVQTGGGTVGYGSEFNDQDFFRDAAQIAYNLTLGTSVRHDLHVGYQWYQDEEELVRSSNGWGLISVPGGRLTAPIAGNPQRAYYTARIQQQSTGQAVPIKSRYRSQSIELNDTIKWSNWTFNVGVLFSNDTLYGQGLREDSSTLSGYVAAPGNRYKMYELGWGDMIQPRVSATWAYNGKDTVYGGWARYNPAASSLPRAASWDRNLTGLFVDAHFDQNGALFGSVPVGSSSGKLFVDDMTPRTTDEFLLGTAKQLGSALVGSALRPVPREPPLLGGHQQQRPGRLRAAPRHPPRALHPQPHGTARADRQRVLLRDRRARRRLHEVLGGDARDRVPERQDLRAGVLHLEQVLRQLRPGQLHDRERRERLHRVVVHRRRGGAPALELPGRDAARRPAAPAEGVRHPPAAVEGDRGRLLRRPVRPALGDLELRAVHRPDHVHQRREPLRGGGRLAPLRLPLAARPQLHAELPLRQAPQPAAPRRRLQRLRQPDRLQHRPGLPQLDLRHPAVLLQPAEAAAGGPPAVLTHA